MPSSMPSGAVGGVTRCSGNILEVGWPGSVFQWRSWPYAFANIDFSLIRCLKNMSSRFYLPICEPVCGLLSLW